MNETLETKRTLTERLLVIAPVFVGFVITIVLLAEQSSNRQGIASRDFVASRPNQVLLPLLFGQIISVALETRRMQSMDHESKSIPKNLAKAIAPIWMLTVFAYILVLLKSTLFSTVWSPSWSFVTLAIPLMTILVITAWAALTSALAWYLPTLPTIAAMGCGLFLFRFLPLRESSNWERHVTGFLSISDRTDLQISWSTVVGPSVLAIALIGFAFLLLYPRKFDQKFLTLVPLSILLLLGGIVTSREVTKNFGSYAEEARTDGLVCNSDRPFYVCLWDENEKFIGQQVESLQVLDDLILTKGASIPTYWTESAAQNSHFTFNIDSSLYERVVENSAEVFRNYDGEAAEKIHAPFLYCSPMVGVDKLEIDVSSVFAAWTATQLLNRNDLGGNRQKIEWGLKEIDVYAREEAMRLDELDNAQFERWFRENSTATSGCFDSKTKRNGVSVADILSKAI